MMQRKTFHFVYRDKHNIQVNVHLMMFFQTSTSEFSYIPESSSDSRTLGNNCLQSTAGWEKVHLARSSGIGRLSPTTLPPIKHWPLVTCQITEVELQGRDVEAVCQEVVRCSTSH